MSLFEFGNGRRLVSSSCALSPNLGESAATTRYQSRIASLKKGHLLCQVLYNDPLLLLGPSTITQPQDGMRLFYDITFPVGKLFVTILTFVNACYEGKNI